ncbi:MAG: hypothetical protein ACKVOM_05205 [Ferruginibacter sp.]
MKKYLFLFLSCAILNGAFAQITIQPILPLGGIVQKNNLWNIAVINTFNGIIDCRIELTLRDRASGLEIITATTSLFQLGIGAKQLNSAFLMPIQYNYISSSVSNRTDDFVPIGNYTACYRLTAIGKLPLAEECMAFDVEPLSPPMLIIPADSAVLEVAPSQFSWIPPAPLNLFNRLDYEVIISEIQPGQKATEAIQNNLPFYTEPNIPVNNLAYTGAAVNFEKEKWYAWQVIAKDDRSYAGKSEVWVFKVKDNTTTKIEISSSFSKMKINNNELAVAQDGILKVLYKNELTDARAEIKIVDLTNTESKKKPNSFTTKLISGDNYIERNLKGTIKLEEEKVYMAQLTNSRGEIFTIRFIVKYTDKK